jgi:general secretion pathway protein G
MHMNKLGFTIVELLVVIVVIGILAAITIVSYTGISSRANTTSLQSDLASAKKQLSLYYVDHGAYPTSSPTPSGNTYCTDDARYCYKASPGNTFTAYSSDGTTFSLTATNTNDTAYSINNSTGPAVSSPYIQTITTANCPSTRTQVHDARDSHTYWVQKLDDGKCWMLTNLGYTGSGTNTYSDTKTLTNGTGSSVTYTVASYYVTPLTTNYTTEPTAPSTSTNGTGQYGYLYNWCAAMGGQATAACANATTPTPVTTTSICPSGWRLPVGNGGEFTALNTAINGGLTNTDAGLIGTPWLAQRGGYWGSGFDNQGSNGRYWSSIQNTATYAYFLYFNSTVVITANYGNKFYGFAVRCLGN